MYSTQILDQSRPSSRLATRQIARSKLLILVAALISFCVSVSLWFMGHENQGLFVGLWVPSILSFGTLLLAGRGADSRP